MLIAGGGDINWDKVPRYLADNDSFFLNPNMDPMAVRIQILVNNHYLCSPIALAIAKRQQDIVQMMVDERCKIDNVSGTNPIAVAAARGDANIVSLLISLNPKAGSLTSGLLQAVAKGHISID